MNFPLINFLSPPLSHKISSVSDFEFDVCGIMNGDHFEMRTDFNKFLKFKEGRGKKIEDGERDLCHEMCIKQIEYTS